MRDDDLELVCGHALFEGLNREQVSGLLALMGARVESFARDDLLVRLDEVVRCAGFVLEGEVAAEFLDESGSVSIVSQFGVGTLFAESLAAVRARSIVEVRAAKACRVMWLNMGVALAGDVAGDAAGDATQLAALQRMTANLVRDLAQKNVHVNAKMQMVSQRRLRERVRLYLALRARDAEQGMAAPELTRTDLARYLSVDRSALSRELGRLADEGVIAFRGRDIVVTDPAFLEG